MSLTPDDVKRLMEPFDEKTIGVKVQSLSKDKTKAMLVCYIQHSDVANRLDSVDPSWSNIVTDEKSSGGERPVFTTRMRMTLKEVTREGVGEGDDPKSAASDSLKRTARLFGVGRYLYDSENVWVPYNDVTDKYKIYTLADYKKGLRPGQAQLPVGGPQDTVPPPAGRPLTALNRTELGKAIDDLSAEIRLSEQDQTDWIQERYKKPMKLLTQAEMIEFHGLLEVEKSQKQERFK